MSKKITIIEEKEICELIKTKSQREIATLFNRSQAGISMILRKNNIRLPKKSRLNPGKLKLEINYFEEIDTKEKAYWLGFICADGNINKNCSKCSLISKDEENIVKFKKEIKSEHKISYGQIFDKRTKKYYQRYLIQITNENFVKHLINKGVTNYKTDKLIIPNIKPEFYSYFFAGLFDGDGSVCFVNNKLRVSLISTKEILLFLQNYLIGNELTSLTKLQKVTINKTNVWKLLLYKDAYNFLNWIYSDCNFPYLSRKYNLYKSIN